MSFTNILDSISKDRVLQLANQYSDWMGIVPEYQVPIWQLFLISITVCGFLNSAIFHSLS